MRGVGETIGAGRQQAAQRSGPEQVLAGIIVRLEREEDSGKGALGPGQEEVAARLRLETGSLREGALMRREALAHLTPCRRADKGYRDRGRCLAAGQKDGMHR